MVFSLNSRLVARGCPAWPRWLVCLGCLALLASGMGGGSAGAQSIVAEDPKDLYHWAYATVFGTGAYRIGESDLFAVRFNPKYSVATFNDDRFSLNLRLPVTLGLQTIDINEIATTPLSDQVATISFVPGLGLTLPVNPRWTLNPYFNYGWGTELQGESSAWIYYTGLNSRFLTRFKTFDLILLNGIQWLGHNPDSGPEDQLARLINGLEADYPLFDWELRGHRLSLKPHLVHFWYFNDLDFTLVNSNPVEVNQEIEVALALGTQEHLNLWLFKIDRMGLGYRKGDKIEGLRLFFDSVFD